MLANLPQFQEQREKVGFLTFKSSLIHTVSSSSLYT
jgi:hypothetical protein